MTALAQGRSTPRRINKRFAYPVSGSATIFAGSMVSLLITGGWAVPGGTNGLNTVEVERDCGRFENSASGDLITHADIGNPAYLVDDQTVAKTDGTATRKIAGSIIGVDALGVWVDVGPGSVGPTGPAGP